MQRNLICTGRRKREVKTLNLKDSVSDTEFVQRTEHLYKDTVQLLVRSECKNSHLPLQGTRKLECLAKISVKRYRLYMHTK